MFVAFMKCRVCCRADCKFCVVYVHVRNVELRRPLLRYINCVQHRCIHRSCRLCTLVKRGLLCDELLNTAHTYANFRWLCTNATFCTIFNVYKYDCYHSRSLIYGNTVHTKFYRDESIQRGCSNVYSQNVKE